MITLGFDPWVQERVDCIQRSWDDYTRYCREHRSWPGRSGRALFEAGLMTTVLPPRHPDRRRKPAHSTVGGNHDQYELFFEHMLYIRDHELT